MSGTQLASLDAAVVAAVCAPAPQRAVELVADAMADGRLDARARPEVRVGAEEFPSGDPGIDRRGSPLRGRAGFELLTHVYEHAGGRRLLVTPAEPHLIVTVSDFGTAVPAKRMRSSTDEGGRGLILIDELTEHWATVPSASGKDIRCAIRLPVRRAREGRDRDRKELS